MADDNIAIAVRGLTKRYHIRPPGSGLIPRRKEDFFALRDVTFDVNRGEVLGVVGRNGAGKSTLLKVLSRIIQPTSGSAVLDGRLAALLEVGTGFHPELTGRENVYLNGTIMGMTKREVEAQFESIVDFAGVSYFLDTPIKRYSSGMFVRLAFAVAAHLRTEILVLDEVLAVGDAAFQRKCLGKVNELAHDEGRTVLLVSHNAAVIRQTASAALRLERGRLTTFGPVEEVLREAAERDSPSHADLSRADRVDTNWGHIVRLLEIEVADGGRVPFGEPLRYTLTLDVRKAVEMGIGQAVTSLDDTPIATSFSVLERYEPGIHVVSVRVPDTRLAPGRYSMNIVAGQSSFSVPDLHYDGVMHAVGFEVIDDALTIDWHPEWWGNVTLPPTEVER